MKELIIVNCFLNNRMKEEIAINCLKQLKKTGFDIMVVSHYDIPYSVREICDFYVYDKNNSLIYEQTDYFWYNTDKIKWKVKRPNSSHSHAALTSVKNAVYLSKSMEYDFFHHIEYDIILSDTDIKKLSNLSQNLKSKKGYFDIYNLSEDHKGVSMLYFSCYVDEFLKIFNIPYDKETYLKGSHKRGIVASENFLFDNIKEYKDDFNLGFRKGDSISLFNDDESQIAISNFGDNNLQFIIDVCEDYNNNDNLFLLFFNLTKDSLTLSFDNGSYLLNFRSLFYHQIFNRNRIINYTVENKETGVINKGELDINKILLEKTNSEFFKFT